MDVRILFNNVRISASLGDGLQRLSFANHVNFIARPTTVDHGHAIFSLRPHRDFTFARFTAAQDQQRRQEQGTIPRSPLGRRSWWTNTHHDDYDDDEQCLANNPKLCNFAYRYIALFYRDFCFLVFCLIGTYILEEVIFIFFRWLRWAILGGSWNGYFSVVGNCLYTRTGLKQVEGKKLVKLLLIKWIWSFGLIENRNEVHFHLCVKLYNIFWLLITNKFRGVKLIEVANETGRAVKVVVYEMIWVPCDLKSLVEEIEAKSRFEEPPIFSYIFMCFIKISNPSAKIFFPSREGILQVMFV